MCEIFLELAYIFTQDTAFRENFPGRSAGREFLLFIYSYFIFHKNAFNTFFFFFQ